MARRRSLLWAGAVLVGTASIGVVAASGLAVGPYRGPGFGRSHLQTTWPQSTNPARDLSVGGHPPPIGSLLVGPAFKICYLLRGPFVVGRGRSVGMMREGGRGIGGGSLTYRLSLLCRPYLLFIETH
ncbi:hypothetical protein B296_00003125 [Ensete ventricosum]|uniref:Uncharacterized protein n=1 Tax=Ensete ventricosum TaxID=4639 RepID=A0A426ZHP4_ENSVE|nr:hypothetical protein B296_00003125 [Ensete ventricosum]